MSDIEPKKKLFDKKRIVRITLFCFFAVTMAILVLNTWGKSHIIFGQKKVPSFTDHEQEEQPLKEKIKGEILYHINKTVHSYSPHQIADSIDLPANRDSGEFGYVFVSHYSDQMTGASFNILSLQCWVSTVSKKVKVVEPFLRSGSRFGVSLMPRDQNNPDEENLIGLRNVLDIDSWGKQTTKMKFARLVSWKDFLKLSPRNLILVSGKCVSDSIKCTQFEDKFYSSSMTFANQHMFKVVRYVYYKQERYTVQEFRNFVYGDNDPSQSVVIFNYWGGIIQGQPKAYRIAISELKHCNRNSFQTFLFHNSKQIVADSQRYLQQYLYGKDYISVMFRSERFALNHGFQEIASTDKKLSMFTDCVNGIGKYVNNLKRQYSLESVFLAMDCRKQGSNAFRRQPSPSYMSKNLIDIVTSMLYQKLYGNSSSLNEWDDSFDQIATFRSPGYLAQLQKNLAANGTCLLTAGGGSFQMSAEALYDERHKSSNMVCNIQVPEC